MVVRGEDVRTLNPEKLKGEATQLTLPVQCTLHLPCNLLQKALHQAAL